MYLLTEEFKKEVNNHLDDFKKKFPGNNQDKWNYNKYFCDLISDFLQKYNKLFLSIYDITEEELKKLLLTDDLCTNIIFIKKELFDNLMCQFRCQQYLYYTDKDMFYRDLYNNLFVDLGFDMIRDIIKTLNYDSYLDLIKIIRSIAIFEYSKIYFLCLTECFSEFNHIFRSNNLSFFTILYQFVNDKDKEYKVYDLSGNIIYTFDFTMIKTISDLIKCIRILNDGFTIIIDGNTFKSIYNRNEERYINDFPDSMLPLTEITDIQDKMIQIVIHQSSNSD